MFYNEGFLGAKVKKQNNFTKLTSVGIRKTKTQ